MEQDSSDSVERFDIIPVFEALVPVSHLFHLSMHRGYKSDCPSCKEIDTEIDLLVEEKVR